MGSAQTQQEPTGNPNDGSVYLCSNPRDGYASEPQQTLTMLCHTGSAVLTKALTEKGGNEADGILRRVEGIWGNLCTFHSILLITNSNAESLMFLFVCFIFKTDPKEVVVKSKYTFLEVMNILRKQ